MPRAYVNHIVNIKSITRCVIKIWSNRKVVIKTVKIADNQHRHNENNTGRRIAKNSKTKANKDRKEREEQKL